MEENTSIFFSQSYIESLSQIIVALTWGTKQIGLTSRIFFRSGYGLCLKFKIFILWTGLSSIIILANHEIQSGTIKISFINKIVLDLANISLFFITDIEI